MYRSNWQDGTAALMAEAPPGAALMHDDKAGVQRQALRTSVRVEGVVVCDAHTLARPHRATVRAQHHVKLDAPARHI